MGYSPELIVVSEPQSIAAESFRTLRTNLQFSSVDRDIKTILITSADFKSGRSMVAANLAVACAQSNKKVLLVDADMRKPELHRLFEVENSEGLSSAIVGVHKGNDSIESYIHTTFQPGLYIMASGGVPPNPSDLLASESMKKLAAKMKAEFDYVLFDCPPLLAVTDSAVIARICDGTILVIRSGKSLIASVKRAKVMLLNLKINLLGAVLNDVIIGKEHHYYHDYRYKQKNKA